MENASTKVLIIGGGVGGLALALFLDKAGISSEIYEAYPYKEGVGGAVNIAPNGMNVLNALGVVEKAVSLGCVTPKINFKNQRGKTFAALNYDTTKKYGQPSLSIARPDLYEVLKTEIETKGIKINYEKKLKSIKEDSVKVTAYFEDGTSSEGDLLVGSDGIHSQTRNYVSPEGPKPNYSGLITFGSFAPISEIKSLTKGDINSLNFAYGTNGFFGYGGRNKNIMMWWTTLPQKKELSKEELDQLTPEKIKIRMKENFKDYFDLIKELIDKSTVCIKISISDIDPLPTWHKGRVVLIGDAAHAVSPNSGQGLSMALEDAMYLAKMLRDNADYEMAFIRFEEHRKPRAEKIVAEGRRRAIDEEILNPIQEKMKEFMMGLFVKLFGDSSDDWIYRYMIDWDE